MAHYNPHSRPERSARNRESKANIEKVVRSRGNYERLVSEEQIHREPLEPLNRSQQAAVEQILSSQDQIVALNGKAGTGKTTTLAVIREAVERQGYQVEGFAPTTRAAKLRKSGIQARRSRVPDCETAAADKPRFCPGQSSLAARQCTVLGGWVRIESF